VVRATRNLRTERRIDPGRWLEAYVAGQPALARHAPAIEELARLRPLHIVKGREEAPSEAVASAVLADVSVIIPMAGLFDVAAERANLEKQAAAARTEVERIRSKLADQRFTTRAPEHVVNAERERLEAAQSRLAGLEARLQELGS
jgi:valyl-tRNA synthetase